MKKAYALVLLMLGCVAIPAKAAWYTSGQSLYTDLKKYDTSDLNEYDRERDVAIAMAFGYVTGVVDSFDGKFFCLPQKSITVGQLNQIVMNFLSKHPEYWNTVASLSVRLALVEQWPCPKK